MKKKFHYASSLLMEVLIRIPSIIDLFRCKSVCKLWLSFVEHEPDFIGRFILQSVRGRNEHEEDKQLIRVDWNPMELVMLTPTSYCFDASQFSLDFLPIFDDGDLYDRSLSYTVVDSSNGLLLCMRTFGFTERYCICNPITKQWFQLPPVPPCSHDHEFQVGFVSDPFYHVNDDDHSIVVNHQFGVKVVRLDYTRYNEDDSVTSLDVEMFSSQTGCWTTFTLELPEHVTGKLDPFDHGPMVPYNEMLYWIVEEGYEFLIFDTNKDEFLMNRLDLPSSALLDTSDEDADIVPFKGLSLCRGSLWVAQSWGSLLRVHSLTDGEWCLEHDVDFLKDMQSSSSAVMDPETWTFHDHTNFFSMHPSDPMIGYVATENMMLECNFGSRRVRVLIENLDVDEEDSPNWFDSNQFYMIPISLPVWPTPLPLLPNA